MNATPIKGRASAFKNSSFASFQTLHIIAKGIREMGVFPPLLTLISSHTLILFMTSWQPFMSNGRRLIAEACSLSYLRTPNKMLGDSLSSKEGNIPGCHLSSSNCQIWDVFPRGRTSISLLKAGQEFWGSYHKTEIFQWFFFFPVRIAYWLIKELQTVN